MELLSSIFLIFVSFLLRLRLRKSVNNCFCSEISLAERGLTHVNGSCRMGKDQDGENHLP
ncbi:hypothetical protein J3P89_15785 [Pseudomonas sp. Z1-14]|uniref:hypothetical protein n=1 Tax=Pseudomonas sp. Z1-14 TaxID=2817409 RepID=UPI003DA9F915